jgi:mRNA-degrading endonuclease toxin of MazEF toxin-antitoxin module
MDVQYGGVYLYEPPKTSTSEQVAVIVTSGSEQSGMRPFIIVSRDLINRNHPTAVGVPMTSKVHKANAHRILLPIAELISEPGSGYVFVNSVAMCDHVRVLDLNLIRKKIGTLSANAMLAVGLGLAFVFDIR